MASSSPMKMNYNLVPSLERMALIKIAIALWHKNDIYYLSKLVIKKDNEPFALCVHLASREWKQIESEVSEKIQLLNQPQSLKDKISCFIRPIGVEILQFIKYHLDLYDSCIKSCQFKIEKERYEEELIKTLINPEALYWTSQGTINRKETAEALIRDENLDIKKRYLLACHYCLENEIFELWNRICDCFEMYNYNNCYVGNKLVRHWTSHVKGKNSDAYARLTDELIENVNLEASKYFFAKLSIRDKITLLRNFDSRVMCTDHTLNDTVQFDLVRFFLSQLNEDQETEVIQKNIMSLLYSVLNWPWQPLFMELAKRGCDFLNMDDSDIFLHEIADLIIGGYKDYDYRVLFRDFWQQIPNTHKRFVVQRIPDPDYSDPSDKLLAKLLRIKDFENFYLILKEATADECLNIFRQTKWYDIDLLDEEEALHFKALHSKAFIHQVFMSSLSKDVVEFAKEFKECILGCRSEEEIERDKETWNKLFEFVDDQLIHNNKRTLEEEGESVVTKKLMIAESEDL